jgi:hypothetical protein
MKIEDPCQGALSVGFLMFLKKSIVHERNVLDEVERTGKATPSHAMTGRKRVHFSSKEFWS